MRAVVIHGLQWDLNLQLGGFINGELVENGGSS